MSKVLKDLEYGYTFGGKEIDVNSPECFAKEIYDRESKRKIFLVKYGDEGRHVGEWMNPYKDEHLHSRTVFAFKKVGEVAFETYLRFLRTRRELFLLQMRRDYVS